MHLNYNGAAFVCQVKFTVRVNKTWRWRAIAQDV